MPKLDPEHPRTRLLSEDEIRTFWHGLERNDLPWDRRTRLTLKFELVTMLRSRQLLGARRNELFDLDGDKPAFQRTGLMKEAVPQSSLRRMHHRP